MKKALGKGLNALIPDTYIEESKIGSMTEEKIDSKGGKENFRESGFALIPITKIKTNKEQPRKEFSPEAIEELAMSIKEKGMLQPIIVKKGAQGDYDLVCGERRLRAAILCGLTEVPAVIKDVAKEEFFEWALIENIQREDLNPIEEADAYRRLMEERVIDQEEVAKRVGKDRSTIANMVRLLRLPEEVRNYLASGQLTAGHARAILGLLTPEHQRQMAKRIIEETLSVRQVEAIVTRSNAQKRRPKRARHLSPEIIDLEQRLERHLGTKVKIHPKKNRREGRIEITYFSLDELDHCLGKIGLPTS
ncbi:MAG: ParB/RepB/Spo0J family partition protein [Candidatus Omnitrophica bacterium]|nr:ParB/RepB/Spo0J family partition protein [Candidatus Omnitrophota bacterium]